MPVNVNPDNGNVMITDSNLWLISETQNPCSLVVSNIINSTTTNSYIINNFDNLNLNIAFNSTILSIAKMVDNIIKQVVTINKLLNAIMLTNSDNAQITDFIDPQHNSVIAMKSGVIAYTDGLTGNLVTYDPYQYPSLKVTDVTSKKIIPYNKKRSKSQYRF